MPTKQITLTVCCTCGRESCDGAIWETFQVLENGVPIDFGSPLCESRCTSQLGLQLGHRKRVMNKAVGDEVDIPRPNWSNGVGVIFPKVLPIVQRIRKVQD